MFFHKSCCIAGYVIKVGDRVRVRPSISKPHYGWGASVTHTSIGTVAALNEEKIKVNFPGHARWQALPSELEVVK